MIYTIQNAEQVFSGQVPEVQRAGNKLSCKGKFGSALFDTNLPIFVRSTTCNHLKGSNDGTFLISAGCSLLKANWEFTALVGGPLSVNYPFTVYLTNLARTIGAAPTFFANFFALGYIEWGAGAAIQRRAITTSTNVVAGALQVNLHRYFKGVPNIGDTVKLYPGCDGTAGTCKAYDVSTNELGKFDNYLNFGGNPFMPVADPSASGQPNLNQQGGKK